MILHIKGTLKLINFLVQYLRQILSLKSKQYVLFRSAFIHASPALVCIARSHALTSQLSSDSSLTAGHVDPVLILLTTLPVVC